MISGQLFTSSRVFGDWSLHIYSLVCAQTARHVGVLHPSSLSPSDESTCLFTKMDNPKRELDNKEESAGKKKKVIVLEERFKLNINGVIDQRADLGSVGTATI